MNCRTFQTTRLLCLLWEKFFFHILVIFCWFFLGSLHKHQIKVLCSFFHYKWVRIHRVVKLSRCVCVGLCCVVFCLYRELNSLNKGNIAEENEMKMCCNWNSYAGNSWPKTFRLSGKVEQFIHVFKTLNDVKGFVLLQRYY